MIYSVFVPDQGLYHYYETPNGHAVNADLPLPSLPADAGKIGVASIDAARRLPSDAKLVGQGWNARGVLAAAPSGVSGLGDLFGSDSPPYGKFLLAAATGALVGAWASGFYNYRVATPRKTSAGTGAVGAMVGFAMGIWAAKKVGQ